MIEKPKSDDSASAELAVRTRLSSLNKRFSVGALADALLSLGVKALREIAGPAEIALALKGLAALHELEIAPGTAASTGSVGGTVDADDIPAAVAVVDETVAAMHLRGFSFSTICDALLAAAGSRAEREFGRQKTMEVLELLLDRYRLGATRAH